MASSPPPLLCAAGVLLVPILLVSCAAKPELTYLAPTERTVTARLEAAYGADAQHIIVENMSTVEVIVTSLRLQECENIKNDCEVVRLREPVKPGQRHRLATVQPANPDRASSFSFSWSWEVASDAPEIPR